MYILIKGSKHSVARRLVTEDTIQFLNVTPRVTAVSGTIELYRDDGFLLSVDRAEDYNRVIRVGNLITLTNKQVAKGPTLDEAKAKCLKRISELCNQIITNGTDVEFESGFEHFNLSIEDQANIDSLFKIVELGGARYPYKADPGNCRIYSAEEIAKIYIAAKTHITYQTAYHDALKSYVKTLDSVSMVNSVQYGMALPVEYHEAINSYMAVAQEEMANILTKLQGMQAPTEPEIKEPETPEVVEPAEPDVSETDEPTEPIVEEEQPTDEVTTDAEEIV